MVDPATGVLLNLIASSIWSAGKKGREWYENQDRRNTISDGLGDLPAEFNNAIKHRIEEIARERGNQELAMIAVHWDEEVANNLDTIEAYFGDEETAIKKISDAIEAGANVDLRKTDREELEIIVAEASRKAIKEFEIRVENNDLDTRLNRELIKEVHHRSKEAVTRLERLENQIRKQQHQRYTLFDPVSELNDAVEDIVGAKQIQFVFRPEIEQIDLDWTIILGPSGSGKTRLLGEAITQVNKTSIKHILIPDDDLLLPQEVNFKQQEFEGDVLLVWDDIHEIALEGEETVVSVTIRKLQRELSEAGYQLHILSTARSGYTDDLPGDINAKTGVWEEFTQIWLETPPKSSLREIADRLADNAGVTLSESARDRLVQHTSGIGASAEPSYIKAAVETAGGKLDEGDIDSLPDTAKEIWTEQYRKLKRDEIPNGRDIWLVLLSFKLLQQTILPPISSISKDIFRKILDGGDDRLAFHRAVESLKEWRWLKCPNNAPEAVGPFIYDIHTIQIEAVDESLTRELAQELSNYLLSTLSEEDIPEPWDKVIVNGRFAVGLPENEEYVEIKEHHLTESIRLAEQTNSDQCNILHNHYGQLLLNQEDLQGASRHFALSLQHQYEYAIGHNSYASSLDRRGYPQLAAKHYALSLQHDYTSSSVHNNYSLFLQDRGHERLAAKHSACSIRFNPNNPATHGNYSSLLRKRGDTRLAFKHAAFALKIDYSEPRAHNSYALLLKERGDYQLASKHFALGLQQNYKNPTIHKTMLIC